MAVCFFCRGHSREFLSGVGGVGKAYNILFTMAQVKNHCKPLQSLLLYFFIGFVRFSQVTQVGTRGLNPWTPWPAQPLIDFCSTALCYFTCLVCMYGMCHCMPYTTVPACIDSLTIVCIVSACIVCVPYIYSLCLLSAEMRPNFQDPFMCTTT